MTSKITKSQEIKRLTTPLTFKQSRAHDCEGNLISCVETLSEVKYVIEPRQGILSDSEIMQYAPDSRAASQIRLDRGIGDVSDVLLVHESLPWLLSFYYLILIVITIPVLFIRNLLFAVILLVLFIVPLIYTYSIFNIKRKRPSKVSHDNKSTTKKPADENVNAEVIDDHHIESLDKYEGEISNLKVLFEVKENVVRQLIEKKFQPPQITYDKFMKMVDSCNKLFYSQADTASNIIDLAVEDTPRIRQEIENKIDSMKKIINQIEDLTNELVININSDSESQGEVQVLLDDMEDLISSVKDYKE